MSILDTITTGRSMQPRRVVIYGTPGIGKTTWAAGWPRPIFLPTEDGTEHLDVARFPVAKSYEDVRQALVALGKEEHDYKTLVIDSADWLERLVWDETCRKHSKSSIEDFGYGKGYIFALEQWQTLLKWLDRLRSSKAMNVIFVAHSKVQRYDDPATEPYDRYLLDIHKSPSALLTEWADDVLFARWHVAIKATEKGTQTRTRGVSSGKRVLCTTERPSHVAKNRLNLPDEIELDTGEYLGYLDQFYGTANTKEQ